MTWKPKKILKENPVTQKLLKVAISQKLGTAQKKNHVCKK